MKRKKTAWKRDGAFYVHRDLQLTAALYLSFSDPGIHSGGWRVQKTFVSKHKRQGYIATADFGNKLTTVEEAKRYVEKHYDFLMGKLQHKFADFESWYEKKAEKPQAAE